MYENNPSSFDDEVKQRVKEELKLRLFNLRKDRDS